MHCSARRESEGMYRMLLRPFLMDSKLEKKLQDIVRANLKVTCNSTEESSTLHAQTASLCCLLHSAEYESGGFFSSISSGILSAISHFVESKRMKEMKGMNWVMRHHV